jgi:hypothetical protein
MRRYILALLGLITITALLIPATAQAGTVSTANPQAAEAAGAQTAVSSAASDLHGLSWGTVQHVTPAVARAGTPAPASSRPGVSSISHVRLAPAQCAALRRSLHDRSANCTATATFHLSATPGATVGRAASNTYWEGYGHICGGAVGGPCKSWWVDLHFAFTTAPAGTQEWVNGFNRSTWCTAGGTNITWCGYTGNGTDNLVIGDNFSSGGWFRFYAQLQPDGEPEGFSWVSWANTDYTFCVRHGTSCYG